MATIDKITKKWYNINMKNFNVEPKQNSPIEDIVGRLGNYRMLELTRQGYRLLRFEPGKKHKTFLVSSEHTLDAYSVPETTVVQEHESNDLNDLNFILPDNEPIKQNHEIKSHVIVNDNHDAWLGTVIKPMDIFDAALQELQTRIESDGAFVDNSPNDQFLVITNEQSGQQKIIKVDIASFILNGSVEVAEEVSEKVFNNGDMLSIRTINFNFGKYLDDLIDSVGLNSKNCAIRSNSVTDILDTNQMNIVGLTSIWRSDSYGERESYNYQAKKLDAKTVLALVQKQLSGLLADYSIQTADGGEILSDGTWNLVPIRSLDQVIDDLVVLADTKGYSLGIKNSHYKADQAGVAFFLMDARGVIGKQISFRGDIRQSAEDAWNYLASHEDL